MHGSVIIGIFAIRTDSHSPRGLISKFALKNHYKEIIKRMKTALKEAGPPFADLTKREVRLFSNSTLDEKGMALAADLGFRGRNTLLIQKSLGSRFLLGGMALPLQFNRNETVSTYQNINCGKCRLCEEACPGGALIDYQLDRQKCLQHWSTSEGPVPTGLMEQWGSRIYGCTICQDVCPWNKKIQFSKDENWQETEKEPDLEFYLTHSIQEIKEHFKGSALGMSWFKPEFKIRNALISIGSTRDERWRQSVQGFLDSEDQSIQNAAKWAFSRLRPDREP